MIRLTILRNGHDTLVVTISSSGFGASQGQGQVWVGGAPATVQSWSDTQITAAVAAGAANSYASLQSNARPSRAEAFIARSRRFRFARSRSAPRDFSPGAGSAAVEVLQNGVVSPPGSFTVDTPQITGVTPASGAAGTLVTISGSGFGAAASGPVWLAGAAGQVTSWSDTQIQAIVAAGAVSGVVRVEQNGTWSNALTFTIPGGTAARLVPDILTMLVGDTHTLKAMSASGAALSGLTWTTSDATVVSLSSDDPPLLTAVAVGHATIKAGGASTDVTVSAGSPDSSGGLPQGTVLWTNAVSGVQKIVPAVPSANGVADVFAYQDGGAVTAIASDGTTAWTADLSQGFWSWDWVLPDFQGGLVAGLLDPSTGHFDRIVRYDGKTGAAAAAYAVTGSRDVYISAVHPDGTIFALVDDESSGAWSVIGIDSAGGGQKFSVPTGVDSWSDGAGIIAGDGYYYQPYARVDASDYNNGGGTQHNYIGVLRVGSGGDYQDIPLMDWTTRFQEVTGVPGVYPITNADSGIVATVDGDVDPNWGWGGSTDGDCDRWRRQPGGWADGAGPGGGAGTRSRGRLVHRVGRGR